jgi:biotin transport system substrate-specific component
MTTRIDRLQTGSLLAALTTDADVTVAIRFAATLFVAVLTAAAAQVSFPLPFTPVPFTLQPMIVLLGGAALGSRLGMSAQVLYLLAGIAGLPVFAASPLLPQGVLRLLGPTGGFLLSYPLAAFVTGRLAERGLDRRYVTSVLAMAAGLAVLFASGVAWLAWFARPAGTGLDLALRQAIYPFITADMFKLIVAGSILPLAWRRI